MIEILLVEDHPVFRSLLSEQIDSQEDMECIGIYGTAPDALAAVERGPNPDIIILDLGLPSMNGLEALPRFRQLAPDTKVMVLTISEDRMKVMEALADGHARKQVADQLNVSINTINTHVRHIYEKLEVHNLTGALKKAAKGGLI